jgi:hydrogenase nickel incorporation protein HypA/HybF
MHELAICQAIIDHVETRAEGRAVQRVEVRIGHFRQVVPDSLQFSWTVLTEGTDLSDCHLLINDVPAVVRCVCGAESVLDVPIPACMTCGGVNVEFLSGNEFDVAWIEVAEAT